MTEKTEKEKQYKFSNKTCFFDKNRKVKYFSTNSFSQPILKNDEEDAYQTGQS
jgi:hypothetical protein